MICDMQQSKKERMSVPSTTYDVVRCRQLEGTFPGDPQSGCWPITSLRVKRGWGSVPDELWPYGVLKAWPPPEPPGLDNIAKSNRIFRYQRIRNSEECLRAIRSGHPVMASFEITRDWFDAQDGVILHEFGHHLYHKGPQGEAVWHKAEQQRMARLLDRRRTERLEHTSIRFIDVCAHFLARGPLFAA